MILNLKIHGKTAKFKSPLLMGILNITPDSFSDGGKWLDEKKAVVRAREMIKEGADIIDIGGESTGPGSKDVSVEEELKRIIPVLEKIAALKKDRKLDTSRIPHAVRAASEAGALPQLNEASLAYRQMSLPNKFLISVDTYKPEVARAALEAGADMINDVTALRFGREKMARLITAFQCPIILMYSKDHTARTSKKNIHYHNVIATIEKFLRQRIKFAHKYGIKKSQIIIDPGMGAFVSGIGSYSFEILRRLAEFKKLSYPILIGTSRKGFLGEALKNLSPDKKTLPVKQHVEATIASSLIALQNGASIIRVHDVKEMKRAMEIWKSTNNG